MNNVKDNNNTYKDLAGTEVVLLSGTGFLNTILLPKICRGRYVFERNNEDSILEYIFIEAKNDKWYVFCNSIITIKDKKGLYYRTAEVFDGCLYIIEDKSNRYILYANEINSHNLVFHNYIIHDYTDIFIGRTHENDIIYSNPLVSKQHCFIRWTENGWYLCDLKSLNGVYVNGKKVVNEKLNIGDIVYIMGLKIIIGIGFISINSDNKNLHFSENKLIPMVNTVPETLSDENVNAVEIDKFFNRLPRQRVALSNKSIEIEAPPMSMNGDNVPMLLRMGGSMVMSSAALLAGNLTSMISSVLFPVLTQKYTDKQKKEYEQLRIKKYSEYLKLKAYEIQKEIKFEEAVLNQNYPALETVITYTNSTRRLWERRNVDDDFLYIRLGYGKIPLIAEIDYPPHGFSLDEDDLLTQMYQLVETENNLNNVPIMTSFVNDFICGVLGSKNKKYNFIKSVIAQLTLLHSYDEVKLVFLCSPLDLNNFEFIKYVPHIWNNYKDFRFLATNANEAYQISEYFKREIENDIVDNKDFIKIMKRRPFYFVIAMDKSIFDSMEMLKTVMQADKNYGVSVLAAFDDLPKECSKIFNLKSSNENTVVYLKDIDKKDDIFYMDPFNLEKFNESMNTLSNMQLKFASQAYSLPKMISFLELYGVGRIEHLNPLQRWKDNNPIKSLAVPVGLATDGSLFTLDLHEKFQGPHGLVAGMTGSGKSEFIITYILSMAINYHPDEVAFILIDYKGGGLAGAFEDEKRGVHLPHVVGTITNLDGNAIQRSLMSIQSELTRRQRIFNDVKSQVNEGTMDIYTYQKLYRNGKVNEPLPHLFIISDEFAELKKQESEFMEKLISAARIGRSLGVHLILATQKPSGVVDAQIWSNTKFRVCLRVQSRADSDEMLKRPEAVELKDTGRFYLQVGYNEFFALGQSAWCGAPYQPKDSVVVQKDGELQILDNVGQPVSKIKKKLSVNETGLKQVVAIVQWLSELAEKEHIRPKKLWNEPLDKQIDLFNIIEKYGKKQSDEPEVLIGLVDDPMHQKQYPLYINLQQCRNLLVVGETGSGKSTMMQTILYNIVTNYSAKEVNYYILDFSSRNLSLFKNLPHCGAFLTDDNEADISELLKLIADIIEERRKLFAELGVSSFNAYKEIHDLPLIILFIDNISRIEEFKSRNETYSKICSFMRNGVGYGIKVIFSISHINDCPPSINREAGDKITLRLKDRYNYSDILGCKCQYAPEDTPGRGMCTIDGECYEYQTALAINTANEKERSGFIQKQIEKIIQNKDGSVLARSLEIFDEEQEYETFCKGVALERIPIGYDITSRKKITMPLQQLDFISLYFGNDRVFYMVMKNLFYAMQREKSRVIIIKKNEESLFDKLLNDYYDNIESDDILSSTENGISKLLQKLMVVISEAKLYRNKYCEENKIADWKLPAAVKRWRKAVRVNTKPVFVIFESLTDLKINISTELAGNLSTYFNMCKGHNIYFIAGFYPDDKDNFDKAMYPNGKEDLEDESEESLNRKKLKRVSEGIDSSFNPEKYALLFGGQLDKQTITRLPIEFSRIVNPCSPINDNKLLMCYHGGTHSLIMPCGALMADNQDADEDEII